MMKKIIHKLTNVLYTLSIVIASIAKQFIFNKHNGDIFGLLRYARNDGFMHFINKQSSFLLTMFAVFMFVSCNSKPNSDNIIVQKPIIVKSNRVHKTGDYSQNRKIKWAGGEYIVGVTLAADTALQVVTDGSRKYYDNKIQLRVSRADGSDFFNRTFTKPNFAPYVSEKINENGALVGIVYDHSDANNIYFTVSVGSPDKTSDEYVPLQIKLNRTGELSISHLNPSDSDN